MVTSVCVSKSRATSRAPSRRPSSSRTVWYSWTTSPIRARTSIPCSSQAKGITRCILRVIASSPDMRHIISILLENEAGALSRVSGLFSARGYNIESLTVAPTEDATLSRMTVVTSGSEDVIEQIIKQLNKLVDVVKLQDLTV